MPGTNLGSLLIELLEKCWVKISKTLSGKENLFLFSCSWQKLGRFPWKLAYLTHGFPVWNQNSSHGMSTNCLAAVAVRVQRAAGTSSWGYFEKLSKNIASLAVNNVWEFLSSEMLESFPNRQQSFPLSGFHSEKEVCALTGLLRSCHGSYFMYRPTKQFSLLYRSHKLAQAGLDPCLRWTLTHWCGMVSKVSVRRSSGLW